MLISLRRRCCERALIKACLDHSDAETLEFCELCEGPLCAIKTSTKLPILAFWHNYIREYEKAHGWVPVVLYCEQVGDTYKWDIHFAESIIAPHFALHTSKHDLDYMLCFNDMRYRANESMGVFDRLPAYMTPSRPRARTVSIYQYVCE